MVDYDLIIVGSGPAGMNACLYATRSNLSTLVVDKNYPGGKLVKTNKIENYMGIDNISGSDLALMMFKHAFSYGGVYEQGNVLDIIDKGTYKEVVFENKTYKCYAVILAMGTSERKIGIPGEEKFYGKGVSYCSLCDASLYKGKNMVVIGNSKYAIEEANYLSNFAQKIYLITNKKLEQSGALLDKRITLLENHEILSINGKDGVNSITVKQANEIKEIETSVVFPLVGTLPDTMLAKRLNIVDEKNYIIVNNKQETSIKGIYAAGDCTNNNLKQIVSASADGAVAATEVFKYINKIKKSMV